MTTKQWTASLTIGLLLTAGAPMGNSLAQDAKMPELIETTQHNITVVCTKPSEPLAGGIVKVCADTRTRLAPLYGLPGDQPIRVNWVPRSRYEEFTKAEYGFPSHSGKGEILPAADIDLPTSLARIVDILDLDRETPGDLARFKKLIGLPDNASNEDILHHLRISKEFYCRYCRDFILPHEIAHGFNIAADTPTRPTWLHEWQAQFAAVLACRSAGRNDDAELFTLYYRMMYRGGKERLTYRTIAECNEHGTKMGVQNYAWFHGALIEMFCQLESECGQEFGPNVLRELKKRAAGKKEITNEEIIAIVSAAAGRDLREWFDKTWGIK